MSYCLFLSEPIEATGANPYKTLCGISVQDSNIWDLLKRLRDAQRFYFGINKVDDVGMFNPQDMLDQSIYDLSSMYPAFSPKERARLTIEALSTSNEANTEQTSALSQSKISYCEFVLRLARDYGAQAFATITDRDQEERTSNGQLRKDYSFLFERFFYFLESRSTNSVGYLVRSHRSANGADVSSMDISNYFSNTTNGRLRSKLIIGDLMFASNELQRMVQVASIVAYTINWGYRLQGMTAPVRSELSPLADLISAMRFVSAAPNGKKNWSFKFVRG